MKWHENRHEIAGTLLALGSLLYEWKLPLETAVKGLRLAYKNAQSKRSRKRGKMEKSTIHLKEPHEPG